MSASILQEKFRKDAQTLALKLDIVCKCLSELLLKVEELVEKLATLRSDPDLERTHEDEDRLLEMKEQIDKMKICLSTLLSRTIKFLSYAEIDKNGINKLEEALANSDLGPFTSYIEQLKRYLNQCDECHEDYMVYYNQAQTTVEEHMNAHKHEVEGKKGISTGVAVSGTLVGASTGALACFLSIPIPVSLGGAAVVGYCTGRAYKNYYNTGGQNEESENQASSSLPQIFHTMGHVSHDLKTALKDFHEILSYILDPAIDHEVGVEKLLADASETCESKYTSAEKIAPERPSSAKTTTPLQPFPSAFGDFIDKIKYTHQYLRENKF